MTAPAVASALRRGAARLRAAGAPSPDVDVRLLLRFAAGWTEADLVARLGDPLPGAAEQRFGRLVAARAERIPLQHLTGSVEFWGIHLEVGPEALIPRPDTEILVEVTLRALRGKPDIVRFADVGCGTGCVALALARSLPRSHVFAVDISAAALRLTARNVRRVGLSERVTLVRGDLLSGFASETLDFVVANLPYIPDTEFEGLEPEVRDHEPRLALAGGPDGLAPLRRLAPMAARTLAPGGRLAVEIGFGQQDSARKILAEAGLVGIAAAPDPAGIPRVLQAERQSRADRAAPMERRPMERRRPRRPKQHLRSLGQPLPTAPPCRPTVGREAHGPCPPPAGAGEDTGAP